LSSEEVRNRATLVIYIDLDNDVGECGVETPVVGIESVLQAAQKFALCRPRDTDVNALFRAIQIFREIQSKGYGPTNIAIVAGAKSVSEYEALSKLAEEVKILRERLGDSEAILVFDSVEDEKAIPIISQYFRIKGMEVVVVEQARSIETAYTVISKIIRKVLTDKSYARLVLGYPGFAMFVLVLLALFNLVQEAFYAILLFVSILMMLKGFGLYEKLRSLSQQPLKILSLGIMLVLISIAIYLMYGEVVTLAPRIGLNDAIGYAISHYSHLILIAISIPFIIRMLRAIQFKDHTHTLLYVTLLVDIMLSYILVQNVALIIRSEVGARSLAILNSIAVALAIAVLTSISEAIIRGQQTKSSSVRE